MKILALCWWIGLLAWAALSSNAAQLTAGPRVEFTNNGQAVIRWSTDVSTGSRVLFGQSVTELKRRFEGEQGVNHLAVLPALEPGTRWFFSVGTSRKPLATNSFTVPGMNAGERARPRVSEFTSAPRQNEKLYGKAPPTRQTWGHLASLPDHFARHGRDFQAQNADDYARMAWEFRESAKVEGLPTKVDSEGVTRIYDPKTGAFGAYNPNGTTKTFFKPGSRDYFDRQPGELVPPEKRN